MYPIQLNISGKICAVIGGGKVAERKVKGLLESGARVRVVSPEITDDLLFLASQGLIEWRQKNFSDEDLDGALLVFATTNDRGVQQKIWSRAEANGQFVNVADDPESCSFQVPASVRRGDLMLTVSTNGKSPALAALVRHKLEKEYGPEYEMLLHIMTLVRQYAGAEEEGLSQPERKNIYKKILHNDIIHWIRTKQFDKLQDHLKNILGPEAELDIKLPKLDA